MLFYPEYDPKLQPAFLAGNKRTCDYAHSKGIKILRWVTDPDIQPSKYPNLHKMMLAKGWFSEPETPPGAKQREWLLDYSNPKVLEWITREYAKLARTGPDFYWVDNNHPTKPVYRPDAFAPDVFRNFYKAIQKGLLSTGRNDILIRSGASAWALYCGVGILDVYAPGPDIQNSWREQQIYAAVNLLHIDYLCHYNFWRRAIDDFFPAGPQTIDQTRAMACLLALTGIGFTTTDIGLPNIPRDRLELLRQIVPIPTIRPLDLYRFVAYPLPRVWVLNIQKGDSCWRVLSIFNWGLRREDNRRECRRGGLRVSGARILEEATRGMSRPRTLYSGS